MAALVRPVRYWTARRRAFGGAARRRQHRLRRALIARNLAILGLTITVRHHGAVGAHRSHWLGRHGGWRRRQHGHGTLCARHLGSLAVAVRHHARFGALRSTTLASITLAPSVATPIVALVLHQRRRGRRRRGWRTPDHANVVGHTRRPGHAHHAAAPEFGVRNHGDARVILLTPLVVAMLVGMDVDVDLTHMLHTGPVRRHESLVRGQRIPANRRRRLARAAAVKAQLPAVAANPAHQGGRPHGMGHIASRRPAPALVVPEPATIVEGRIAPGRVVDPGPAPWRHPGPAAVAVGRPADGHHVRHPQAAVFDALAPAAVPVQFLVAGHLGRHVAVLHDAAVVVLVARLGPVVEGVARGHAGLHFVAAHGGALAGAHRQVVAAAIEHGGAGEHGDDAGVAHQLGIDPHPARFLQMHIALRRAQLEALQQLRVQHPQADAAVVQAQAEVGVVELDDLEGAVAVDPHRRRAEPEFGARAGGGDDFIVGSDGPVQQRAIHLAVGAGVDVDLALHQRDAAGPPGRFVRAVGAHQGRTCHQRQQRKGLE